MITKENIIKRFVSYVTIDTESDPNNPNFPSTEKQWNLARLLEKELKDKSIDIAIHALKDLPAIAPDLK